LHVQEEHPDIPLLKHVKELVAKLETLGIRASPPAEGGGDEDVDDWEDVEESEDGDGDVDMS